MLKAEFYNITDADPGCLYRIRIFHPGYRVKKNPVPDPDPHHRVEVFLTQKLFLSSRKNDLGCSFRIPDPDFFPFRIPDPGVKKVPDHITKKINKFQKENVTIILNKNDKQYTATPPTY